MKKTLILATLATFVIVAFKPSEITLKKIPSDVPKSEITVPAGFKATILGTELGSTRHLTVSKNGVIYAKLSKLKDGKGIVVLRDDNKDGKIEKTEMFGNYPGTGITIKNGYLYASSNNGVMRYKLNEKEEIMAAFKHRHIDLLVATTVIEVGVDVPNASLMIIENAERLGLSQLHQLRGRVGRGAIASHCLLMYQPPLSRQSTERLKTMRETNDGFVIAEKDLALRGAGELLGVQQTGYKDYKIACLQRDKSLLPLIKELARSLIQQNPDIAHDIATRWLGNFEAYLQG